MYNYTYKVINAKNEDVVIFTFKKCIQRLMYMRQSRRNFVGTIHIERVMRIVQIAPK